MSSTLVNGFYRMARFILWALVLAMLFAGWRLRDYHLISPKEGIGFALGITGGLSMLMLLCHPLRKRIKKLSSFGSVKFWFRLHMILGVLGPVIIIFHANFRLGALNSNVALLSMLVVAVSGLFGRYFYGKIHHGLYGSKADLSKMQEDLGSSRGELVLSLDSLPEIKREITGFLERMAGTEHDLAHAFYNAIVVPWHVRSYRDGIADKISDALLMEARDRDISKAQAAGTILALTEKMDRVFSQSMTIAEFLLFDRLFSLWHVFHIPIFFIMIAAILIHIATVLLY